MELYALKETSLTCSCSRTWNRTLALPIDEQGRPATYSESQPPTFSCLVCNEGKSTPRRSLLPGDEDRIVQYAVAGEAPTIEGIAWTLHLREEDVKIVLLERGIEIAEYDEED